MFSVLMLGMGFELGFFSTFMKHKNTSPTGGRSEILPHQQKDRCIGSFTNILAANIPPDLCGVHTSLQ